MAHSRIFQVSIQPIEVDDYASPSDFYENCGNFADYIGDEIEDEEERKEEIKYLAEKLEDLFDLDETGTVLVYKGTEAMKEFLQEWADAIRKAAQEITADNILKSLSRRAVRLNCERTHLQSHHRFYIEDWNGYAGPMDDLVEWIDYTKFKAGQKIYIGAVIDYHY